MTINVRAVDTLTGRIVTRLLPVAVDLPDPLVGSGAGNIRVALPADQTSVRSLLDAVSPRRRWLWVTDERDRHLWCGPVVAPFGHDDGVLTVPVADWRAWFYSAPLRPDLDTEERGDYLARDTDQATIATTLAKRALDTTGAPAMVVDTFDPTGVVRDRTSLLQLDRSVGDYLDSMSRQKVSDGFEWHVYAAIDPSDPLRVVPHVSFSYPERRTRESPVPMDWRIGVGGNLTDPSWPTGQPRFTRVWAVGEGDPPDQPWAMDEDLDIGDGLEVAWETVLGPLDGVSRSKRCFEYATAAIDYYEGLTGQVSADLLDVRVPVGGYSTGDRARLVFDDGARRVEGDAIRITERTITWERAGRPLGARVTLDLADDGYGDTGAEPGEVV